MTEMVFATVGDVETILHDPDFAVPPPPRTTIGAVAELRAEMARFSNGGAHGPRRRAVEALIDRLDEAPLEAEAGARTAQLLTDRPTATMAEIGFVVPTETLASALGVPDRDLSAVRCAVLAVVEVIGRKQPGGDNIEEAVTMLRDCFRTEPEGSVAAISLLYQTHDATAALLRTTLEAARRGGPRRAAVTGTERVAARSTVVNGLPVAAGTRLVLDLGATNLEFGAGPHRCPGRRIAERIVAGIVARASDAG